MDRAVRGERHDEHVDEGDKATPRMTARARQPQIDDRPLVGSQARRDPPALPQGADRDEEQADDEDGRRRDEDQQSRVRIGELPAQFESEQDQEHDRPAVAIATPVRLIGLRTAFGRSTAMTLVRRRYFLSETM